MLVVYTTTISIYRALATDTWGDAVEDNTTAVATGIKASLLTGPRQNQRPVDGTPRVIRFKTLRIPAGTDLRVDDRIQSEKTGQIYTVDEITQPENIVATQDIQAKLRLVT